MTSNACLRLAAASVAAPLAAVVIALASYQALWSGGLLSGGASIAGADAAASLGLGVVIIALLMTATAVPLLFRVERRRSLSFRLLILLGAVLGNVPFAAVVTAVAVLNPGEVLSGTVGRYWYGASGAMERIVLGLASGTSAAAVFWVVALRPSDRLREQAQAAFMTHVSPQEWTRSCGRSLRR